MIQHPLFADLPPDEKSTLIQLSKPVYFRRGEVLVHAGEPVRFMLLVADGMLKVETVGSDGVASATGFIRKDDVYLESIEHTAEPSKSIISAALNSGVHRIPLDALRTTMGRHPTFALRLLQRSLDDQQQLRKQLRRIATTNVEVLIGRTLYELSTAASAGQHTVDKRITQSEIAAYACTSRERVNRTMRELERQGLIRRGNEGIDVDTSFSSTNFGSFDEPDDRSTD